MLVPHEHYVIGGVAAHPDNKKNGSDSHKSNDGMFKPLFAVLEVEARFGEVPEKLGLFCQLVADGGANVRTERGQRERHGC